MENNLIHAPAKHHVAPLMTIELHLEEVTEDTSRMQGFADTPNGNLYIEDCYLFVETGGKVFRLCAYDIVEAVSKKVK